MARTTALVAALLPALTAAHFSILHPPTAFVITGEENKTPPCGYGTPPDPQASAHPYLTSGSQIALSTHGDTDWTIQYTLDAVPAAPGSGGNWSEMIAPIETEGDGNFCITTAQAAASAAGSKGWISVRGEMPEGTYYQCAYVNFVNVTTLEFPVVCANSIGVKVGWDTGDDDDDDDKTTSTTTSTRYTNSSTTKSTTITTGITSTSAGTTTLTGTNTSPTVSMPSPTDDDDGDGGDDDAPSTRTNQPTPTGGDPPPPTSTDTPPPAPTGGDDGDDGDDDGQGGPSTITSTSVVVPTQTGGGGQQTGTVTSSGVVQVPTGAAVNTKGSPLGMAGFSAVVLGAGILCAGLLA